MRKINTDLPEYIFYNTINSLIEKISEEKEDSEISWNSKGGSVWAGFQFIDFLNNNDTKLTANVTGIAASMGAVLLPFFSYVRGANQADFMLHSSSGGDKSTAKNTNKTLYEALSKKIDEPKFKEITGHELKTVMMAEGEDRIDVWFTGKQAKKFKLLDESYDLFEKSASIEMKDDFKELGYEVPEEIKNKYSKQAKNVKSNHNEMEIKDVKQADLKSGNPSVYNAIVEEGKKAEQERTASIMKYAKYDMEKANEMIEKGATLGIEDVEHFMDKKHADKKVAELEEDSQGDLNVVTKKAKVEVNETVEQREGREALEAEKRAILEESGYTLK